MEAVEEKVDNTRLGNIRKQFEGVIPDNWALTTLGEAFKWRSGGTPLRTNPRFYGGDIPWLIIGDLNDGVVTEAATSITEEGLASSATRWVEEGSVLLAMYGSIGKLGIAGRRLTTNQAIAFTEADPHDAKYLFYYLMYSRESLASLGKGATQKNISQAVIKEYPIPLAPLPQQRRIVSAIELQLGRLDEAVARLHGAKAKLKNYRLGALDAAFGGQLTGERLTTDGVPLGWKLELSGDLMPDINNGYTPTAEKLLTQGARPFIKVYNLTFTGALDYTLKPTFIDEETHSKGLKRSICYPGDVLINIVGPPLGKVSRVTDEYPEWNINQAIVRFRPSARITSRYLTYLMQSPRIIRWLTDRSRATAGQHNVRVTTCREIPMPVCDVAHQERVADAIDDQLNAHRAIEQTIDAQLERSTRLRQAVLKRAFEGRLV